MTVGKTVSEIAREIGISRQALYRRIKTEPLSTSLQAFTSKVDGVLYISADGEKLIVSACHPSHRELRRVNRNDNVDSKVDSKSDVDSKVDSKVDSDVDSDVDSNVDSDVDSKVDSDVDTTVDSSQERLLNQMASEIGFLRKQIDVKDRQLSDKDKQIEQLSESLRASQMLQAGLVQQIQCLSSPSNDQTEPMSESDEPKSRWNIFKRWKAK